MSKPVKTIPPGKGSKPVKTIPPGKGGGPKKTLPPKKNPLPAMRHVAFAALLLIGLAAGMDPGPQIDHTAAAHEVREGWGSLVGVALALTVALLAGAVRLTRARRSQPDPPPDPPPVPDPWPSPWNTPNTPKAALPGRLGN